MSIFSLIEAPFRMVIDPLTTFGSKKRGKAGRGRNLGGGFKSKPFSKKKTGYGKKFPNYSDRNKNMMNAKKIRETFHGLK